MKFEDCIIGNLYMYLLTNEVYLFLGRGGPNVEFFWLNENKIVRFHHSYLEDFRRFELDEKLVDTVETL